jgi:hypothetical protein
MDNAPSRFDWLISLGQFGAWILTSVAAVIDALYIRNAAQAVMRALQVVEYEAYQRKGGIGLDLQFGFALTAVDDILLLVLGCAALAAVIGIEYYMRKGRPKGLLLKRIGKVVLIEVIIFAVAILVLMFV